MRTLAHLDLHLSLPSEGASAATAAAESFPDVSTLAQGIEQIAPIFSDIPFLDLRNTKLSDRASEALARTIDTHTSLTQLDLRRNQLSSLAVPRIFSALSRNTSLESLKLGHNLLNFFPACASPTVT